MKLPALKVNKDAKVIDWVTWHYVYEYLPFSVHIRASGLVLSWRRELLCGLQALLEALLRV